MKIALIRRYSMESLCLPNSPLRFWEGIAYWEYPLNFAIVCPIPLNLALRYTRKLWQWLRSWFKYPRLTAYERGMREAEIFAESRAYPKALLKARKEFDEWKEQYTNTVLANFKSEISKLKMSRD